LLYNRRRIELKLNDKVVFGLLDQTSPIGQGKRPFAKGRIEIAYPIIHAVFAGKSE
jgi:hypothetical protein